MTCACCTCCKKAMTPQEVATYGNRCENCWASSDGIRCAYASELPLASPGELENISSFVTYNRNPDRRGDR